MVEPAAVKPSRKIIPWPNASVAKHFCQFGKEDQFSPIPFAGPVARSAGSETPLWFRVAATVMLVVEGLAFAFLPGNPFRHEAAPVVVEQVQPPQVVPAATLDREPALWELEDIFKDPPRLPAPPYQKLTGVTRHTSEV